METSNLTAAIEADAERMWAQQLHTQAMIERVMPKRHVREADLLIGNPSRQGSMFAEVLELVRSDDWRDGEDGLLLVGGEGCGKTTALSAVAAHAIRSGKRCVYFTPTDMVDYIKTKEINARKHKRNLYDADLLVVDEIHRADALPDWLRSEFVGVIDYRYREMCPTIGAGTVPVGELTDFIGLEIIKRFKHRIGSDDGSHRA